MKRKFLCLLLALAVVMSVVPLTALAEENLVPEEYRGKRYEPYEPEPIQQAKDAWIAFDECGDSLVINVPYYNIIENSWPFWYYDNNNGNYKLYFGDEEYSSAYLEISMHKDDDRVWVYYKDDSAGAKVNRFTLMLKEVSDSTGSTLSAGSNLIIPIAAAVLLIGGVIFIGKRKKEITE